jgi:DNA-binding MarR family transcriptional regulator
MPSEVTAPDVTQTRPAKAHGTDISHDLRLAVMRLARRLRQQRADHRLSFGQMSVLSTLDRHGAMTAGALAAYEQVQPPSMTKTVGCLLEAGLVTRTPSSEDRRQVVLDVTPAARSLLDEDRRRRDAWLASVLRELDEAQRAALTQALPVLEVLAEK